MLMNNSNKSLVNSINETMESQAGADSAIDLLSHAILPKAVELARSGKYREAETILQHLIQDGGVVPAIYDLLARIRVQQGQLLEAQIFWAEAIQLSPTKGLYRSALKRIERLQKRSNWVRRIGSLLLGLGLIFGTIMIIIAIRPYLYNFKIDTIKTVKSSLPKQTVDISREPLPKVAIHIPDVLVNTQANQVIITFKSGLFLHNAELQPEAKTILATLAEQLQPYVGRIQVHVEGHTDDLPIINELTYRDNVSLGLHRAVAVIDYLRLKGKLPAKMFTASGLGELQSLYPNDTFNNQLRNRTVIIRIVAIKEG